MDSMTRERTTANSTSSGLAARFFPLPISRGCEVISKHPRSPTSVIRTPRRRPRQRLGFSFLGRLSQYLIFNGLVRCVSADRATTYPAADRRKTKPSGRKARARLDDHDPPTPTDRANARREHEMRCAGAQPQPAAFRTLAFGVFPRTAS